MCFLTNFLWRSIVFLILQPYFLRRSAHDDRLDKVEKLFFIFYCVVLNIYIFEYIIWYIYICMYICTKICQYFICIIKLTHPRFSQSVFLGRQWLVYTFWINALYKGSEGSETDFLSGLSLPKLFNSPDAI